MKWCILVNRMSEVQAAQTTWLLAAAAAQRGHDVVFTGVADLALAPSGEVEARVWPVQRRAGVSPDDPAHLIETNARTPERVSLDQMDVVLIRTSPARDGRAWAHGTAMMLMGFLAERDTLVLNSPEGLMRAASKLYLNYVPERWRPRTLVSRDPAALRAFVEGCEGGAVLKPTVGTRGTDVFLLPPGNLGNFNQIVDILTRQGFAMAQAFVPEASEGDTRIILVDGAPLRVGDTYAAVRRVPTGYDFRSNVHVGAYPAPAEMRPEYFAIAEAVGPRLRQDGLFMVGLDVIGTKVVEINVFSSGGLKDASRFAGVDFSAAIVDHVDAAYARFRESRV